MNEFDNLIYQAFDELESERLKVIDAYEDPLAKLSRRYQRCIARLCSSSERRPLLSRPAAKRLVAAMLILVLLSTTVIGVKAIHGPLSEFITKIVGKWLRVEYDSNYLDKTPEALETIYAPQYVPEGYTLVEEERYLMLCVLTWENEHGEKLMFSQTILDGTRDFKDELTEEIQIGETRVIRVTGNGVVGYYWDNDEYGFYIHTWEDVVSVETIEQMMDSVTPTE